MRTVRSKERALGKKSGEKETVHGEKETVHGEKAINVANFCWRKQIPSYSFITNHRPQQ